MLMKDKTAVVTGVGVGLGREVAAALLAEGAKVVIAARNEERLTEAAAALDPTGENVLAHVTDIGDQESCNSLAAAALDRFGSIDALVQVAAREDAFGGVLDADLERWTQAFETNVVGAMHAIRACAPALKERRGAIVLVGSQSMFKPSLPQAGYGASKGALLTTMYYLADELGPEGIRVNTVVPSWMWGPNVEMFVDFRASSENKTRDEVLGEITGSFPLRRMTEDGEVADAAVFFCSSLSRGITGQNLLVNCGEMMR
jgi:NAD(P)-dependent dehydrogenase (short-subunit alcohol dehydrogenase family)